MAESKVDFLKNDFVPLLGKLKPGAKGVWGIMDAQQMVEHFADAVKNASGKLILPQLSQGEHLEKMRLFLMSEQPLKENTDNPLIPKEGIPHRQPDLQSAINKLQSELDFFFKTYQENPSLKTGNAFFGSLDYEMNIQLLYKHAMHHLRQFGLV